MGIGVEVMQLQTLVVREDTATLVAIVMLALEVILELVIVVKMLIAVVTKVVVASLHPVVFQPLIGEVVDIALSTVIMVARVEQVLHSRMLVRERTVALSAKALLRTHVGQSEEARIAMDAQPLFI